MTTLYSVSSDNVYQAHIFGVLLQALDLRRFDEDAMEKFMALIDLCLDCELHLHPDDKKRLAEFMKYRAEQRLLNQEPLQ